MRKKEQRPVVPVYMFHSIADTSSKLPYGHLSTPVKAFMRIVAYLHRAGFNTITLNDLYGHLSQGSSLPNRSIVLTFDDGYLDNWVNVFPILVKYKMKATMFVVPEFVDPRGDVRPTLLDVWERKARIEDLQIAGFLSWNEMMLMKESGLIDIQSHALTHTCTFQGPEIIDFHHPGDLYAWLSWNKYPERKYGWGSENQEEYVEFGAPVYSYGRALAGPQYFPDESVGQTLQDYVKQHGGRRFFSDPGWKARLFGVASAHAGHRNGAGRYETQAEYEERVRRELSRSKEMIESALGKMVQFLCWPGGAVNETTRRIAREVGYLSTTKGTSKNTWGADPGRINRIGGEIALTRNHPWADTYVNPVVFAAKVGAYRGDRIYTSLLRLGSRVARAGRRLIDSFRGRGTQLRSVQ
jgi:peptidoglycan/xylan/chitin deacetylase (PgdA/CDA1 family)